MRLSVIARNPIVCKKVMMDPVTISVSNLSKHYGRTVGVRKIDFTVTRGEVFGFLGPNGAGETTTIRMLLDLLRPSSGEINILGFEVKKHALEIRKRCGYVPGNFSAYGGMTGADFLNEGKTVFFSSHNLREVEKVCHRIAIIRNGELVALETLEGLKKKKLKRLKFTFRQPVSGLKLSGVVLVEQRSFHTPHYCLRGVRFHFVHPHVSPTHGRVMG